MLTKCTDCAGDAMPCLHCRERIRAASDEAMKVTDALWRCRNSRGTGWDQHEECDQHLQKWAKLTGKQQQKEAKDAANEHIVGCDDCRRGNVYCPEGTRLLDKMTTELYEA